MKNVLWYRRKRWYHRRQKGATTLSITTFSITTFSIMTLSIMHSIVVVLNVQLCWVSFMLCVIYQPCMLSNVMLSVVMLNVVMLSVAAPCKATLFVTLSHFHPSLIFKGMACKGISGSVTSLAKILKFGYFFLSTFYTNEQFKNVVKFRA